MKGNNSSVTPYKKKGGEEDVLRFYTMRIPYVEKMHIRNYCAQSQLTKFRLKVIAMFDYRGVGFKMVLNFLLNLYKS
jgi:hypothetical protein